MKYLSKIFLILLLFSLLPLSGFATETTVYDLAGILGSESSDELAISLNRLEKQYHLKIYLATTNDTQGLSTREYAKSFYTALNPADGFLLLIDTQNQALSLSICGNALAYFPDDHNDDLLDSATVFLKEGDYLEAAYTLVNSCDDYLAQGVKNNRYYLDPNTGFALKKPPDYGKIAVFSTFFGALFAAFIGYFTVKRYKAPAIPVKNSYSSQMTITTRQEIFINKSTHRQHITQALTPTYSEIRRNERQNNGHRTITRKGRRLL